MLCTLYVLLVYYADDVV